MIDFKRIKNRLVEAALEHCHGVTAAGTHPSDIEIQCPSSTNVHVFVKGKLKFRVFAQLVEADDGVREWFIRHETAEKVKPIKGFEQWFPASLTSSAP